MGIQTRVSQILATTLTTTQALLPSQIVCRGSGVRLSNDILIPFIFGPGTLPSILKMGGNFDLACLTKIWIREDKTVSLSVLCLVPQPYINLGLKDGKVKWFLPKMVSTSRRSLSNISGINCMGRMWSIRGKLAVLLVYQPPNTSADTLLKLAEAIPDWVLCFLCPV